MSDATKDLTRLLERAACPPWCSESGCFGADGGVSHSGGLVGVRGDLVSVVLESWATLEADGLDLTPYASLFVEGKGTDATWSASQLRTAAAVLHAAADRMDEILGAEQ